jgi:hypothetical protein
MLVLGVAQSAAQTSAWQVAVYHETVRATPTQPASGEIVVIGAGGITQRLPVPQIFYNPYPGSVRTEVIVSPDLRYGAGVVYPSSEAGAVGLSPIQIFDLSTGECCKYVNLPFQPVEGVALGEFDPTNRQFALAYVSVDLTTTEYNPRGGLVTIDAATGAITSSVDYDTIRAGTTGDEFIAFAYVGTWDASGVRILPSCWACEGVFEGSWFNWTPGTASLTLTSEFYTIFGSKLDITGEMLYTTENRNYPIDLNEAGYFPPANVVEYYFEGTPYAGYSERYENQSVVSAAPLVYFDPNNLNLPSAQWVADGRAFVLMRNPSMVQSMVVFRDGSTVGVASDVDERVIAGTPDGWLTQGQDFTIYQYTLSGTTVTRVGELQLLDYAQVVLQPRLGASVTQPFVTTVPAQVAPPLPAPVQVTCPGFLPSRLQVGGTGRVTPGTPNNLRAQPNLTAPLVGQIPGGNVFTVLSGPFCDQVNGMAWWQVNHNGSIGWTGEGQGNVYWVEPAN